MANIEYDPSNEKLIVRDVGSGLRNPLLAAFVRQAGGSTTAEGVIEIPTNREALTSRYQTLVRLFEKVGVQIELDGEASDALEEVKAEELRFEAFSREASQIWNAQIDTDDFRQFVEAVKSQCPGRIFYRKQLLAAFHLAFSQNACNFSVPGAGKTSVVYAAYSYLRSLPPENDKSVDRLLIVGPLSSFKAWEDEYLAIFKRKAVSRRISGAVPSNLRYEFLHGILPQSRENEVVLTTYQTLTSSEGAFETFLKHVGRRAMMVLDEAHYVKSSDGLQAAATLRLAPHARARVVLTGTPAPNGYEDLSNLFKFIYPSRNIIGFPAASLRAMTDGSLKNAIPELKKNIQPFFTRIKKKDLELPDAQTERIAVSLSKVHEQIYRSLETRIVPQLKQHIDDPVASLRIRARLIRLRQAAVNPELLLKPLESEDGIFDTAGTGDLNVRELEVSELIKDFNAAQSLNRLAICQKLAHEILHDQGKVLIWSYFLSNLEILKNTFKSSAPFVEVLTGATPVAGQEENELTPAVGTREEIIDRFHSTSDAAVLIANPQAVGESISLHKACRTAIYFDRDFNAGRFIQSKDRIHRYSPKKGGTVKYFYLVAPGTVDQDIDMRLTIKERRLADLVDADDIPLLTATSDENISDDIRTIFEAYERRKIH